MGAARAASDWRPAAGLSALRLRAGVLERIRRFFAQRGVMEVSTPVVTAAGLADPHIEPFTVSAAGADGPRYLHTSPEAAMKRLLAAGSGDIFQVCPVFRAGESGSRHNPEFSLLEWYRLGFDHHRLMDEVEALLRVVLGVEVPARRITYRQAFVEALGLDPLSADDAELVAVAEQRSAPPRGLALSERDAWLDWLMSSLVAPSFERSRATLVHAYPASQCALARLQPGSPPTAARFELYWGELELANGYHELTDPGEQAARFEAERARRQASGQPAPVADGHLLDALSAGLPDCAGVALGLDRLLMLAGGYTALSQVLAFPWARA